MKHVTVYRKSDRYAGWPANYGIWSWGDEIVFGFTVGYPDLNAVGLHTRDKDKPFTGMQGRSLDGGETWQVEQTPCRAPGDKAISADEHMQGNLEIGDPALVENPPVDPPGGIDFTHPDFALMCARTGLTAGSKSWFYYSYDLCKTWEGPFKLPTYDQTGIAARTDYLVSSRDESILFLTASKPNGKEGRVFCTRTDDGGKNFDFLSWIGPEPEGFTIMPSSVRISESRIVAALRCRDVEREKGAERNWIDLYISDDNGATWNYMNTPVPNTGRGGNPPAMIKLRDGRLCLTYGYRDAPFGIRASLSSDDGATWGEEIVLRDDGGNADLGYPRTVERADGKVVTIYYFNDDADGERYIAATIWQP